MIQQFYGAIKYYQEIYDFNPEQDVQVQIVFYHVVSLMHSKFFFFLIYKRDI